LQSSFKDTLNVLPVNSNTAPVTYILTDLVPTVTGEKRLVTGEHSGKKTAYLSWKVLVEGQ
jgi:hypothetical protein